MSPPPRSLPSIIHGQPGSCLEPGAERRATVGPYLGPGRAARPCSASRRKRDWPSGRQPSPHREKLTAASIRRVEVAGGSPPSLDFPGACSGGRKRPRPHGLRRTDPRSWTGWRWQLCSSLVGLVSPTPSSPLSLPPLPLPLLLRLLLLSSPRPTAPVLVPFCPGSLLSPPPRPPALPLPHPALPSCGTALAFRVRDVLFVYWCLISCQVGLCLPPLRAAGSAGPGRGGLLSARLRPIPRIVPGFDICGGGLGGGGGGVGGRGGGGVSEARRGGDVWDAQPWDGNAAQTDRQTHTHAQARTHTKPETKDNPKKDSLCLDDSTQLITVSPLSVASPSCRCCRWQRKERLKVTHRGPPLPLPGAARHPSPPRSPGERRSLLFSSPRLPRY